MWYYSIYLRIDVNMKLFSGIFLPGFSVWMLPVPYILCVYMWIYFIFCVTHVFFIVIYFKKYTFCIYMYGISLFIWCIRCGSIYIYRYTVALFYYKKIYGDGRKRKYWIFYYYYREFMYKRKLLWQKLYKQKCGNQYFYVCRQT